MQDSETITESYPKVNLVQFPVTYLTPSELCLSIKTQQNTSESMKRALRTFHTCLFDRAPVRKVAFLHFKAPLSHDESEPFSTFSFVAYKAAFVGVNKGAAYNPDTPRDLGMKQVMVSAPHVTEVRVVMTRPRRALQPAVMATYIIADMKAIKIWRINSRLPHLDLATADEYGAVMDLQGCHDCGGCNKAEVML